MNNSQQKQSLNVKLENIYDAYNTSVFGGRLPSTRKIPVHFDPHDLSAEGSSRLKYTIIDDHIAPNSSSRLYVKKEIRMRVYVSREYHEKAPESVLRNTMLREMCNIAMIHLYNILPSPYTRHSPEWQNLVNLAMAKHPEVGKIVETRFPVNTVYEFICRCTRKGQTCHKCSSLYIAV